MADCSTTNTCSSISESAKELAMANPLILRKVLDHLSSPSDLLNCRLVASTWNEFATEILLSRQSILICLKYSPDSNSYFKAVPDNKEELNGNYFEDICFRAELLNLFPLTQLTDLLSTAKKFPCSHFCLTAGELDGPEMSQFLQIYGSRIKTLKLDLWSGRGARINRTNVTTVRKLLLEQLRNIKSLHILYFPVEYEEYSDIPDIRTFFKFGDLFEEFDVAEEGKQLRKVILAQLPSLEKIMFHYESYHRFHNQDESGCLTSKRVIQDVMLSTRNLELMGSWLRTCVDCITLILTTNQLDILTLLITKNLELDMLERLAQVSTQLKLNYVVLGFQNIFRLLTTLIPVQRNRMARALEKILSTAQISPDFRISGPLGFLPGFELSVYDKIKHLKIYRDEYDAELAENQSLQGKNLGEGITLADLALLPPNFDLAHSFPNINSLSLGGWTFPDFLDCDSLPTVKWLKISPRFWDPTVEFSEPSFSKLVRLLPNLVGLQYFNTTNFPTIAKHLWKFIKLDTLFIGFDVSRAAPGNSNRGHAMDAAFTGFTVETCQRLAKSKKFCKWARTAAKISQKKKELKDESTEDEEKDWGGQKEKTVLKLPTWLDKLRVNPSICDLKELVNLQLILYDRGEALTESYAILSEVTALFAFQVMPSNRFCVFPSAKKRANFERMKISLRSLVPYIGMDPDSDWEEE